MQAGSVYSYPELGLNEIVFCVVVCKGVCSTYMLAGLTHYHGLYYLFSVL
jgi:hypothetical protein